MKGSILPAFILLIIAPISHGQKSLNYEQIKPYVVGFLEKVASTPAECDLFKGFLSKDPANEHEKKGMLGFCDSDIDFSKPVSYSQMSTHHVEGADYVCGIVSGRTLINRKIGARFISAEPYHLILDVKYSRRPIAYASNDEFLVDNYRLQVKSFNELYEKYCQ